MDREYRGFLLRGATLRSKPQVAVLAGQTRHHIADGSTIAQAFDYAQKHVDAIYHAAATGRRSALIGSKEEYFQYFMARQLRSHERKMLVAHARAPDRIMSSSQLAASAGWNSFGSANIHYGALGGEVGRALRLTFPRRPDGTEFLMSALVEELPNKDASTGHIRFRLHEEVAQALTALGIV